MDKQITRRQHYIPKMILKRHALSQICENDQKIFYLNKKGWKNKYANYKDLAYEDFLYEFKIENKIMCPNLIENKMSNLENECNQIITKILSKEEVSDSDLCWLLLFTTLQITRMPEIIKIAENMVESKNLALKMCLLWGQNIEDSQIFDLFLKGNLKRDIKILKSEQPFILGLERPVVILKNFTREDHQNLFVIFPFSSHYCLFLNPFSKDSQLFIEITKQETEKINSIIYENNNEIASCEKINPFYYEDKIIVH